MWDFLKKLKKEKHEGNEAPAAKPAAPGKPAEAVTPQAKTAPAPAPAPAAPAPKPASPAAAVSKPHAQKTDEELAEELNKLSPEILTQARNPQMRKMVIDLYRKMLVAGVNVKDEKEVKKWLKKHPEAAAGGEVQNIETVRRDAPKVGRNDPCVCGSGKKFKKCCGAGA